MADALVSGTSAERHGGSSPLERTFCKSHSPEGLTENPEDFERSSARVLYPLLAGFYALFFPRGYALFLREEAVSLFGIFVTSFCTTRVAEQDRGRAPPYRRAQLNGNKDRRFERNDSEALLRPYELGMPRILAISKTTVPRWVRGEVVHRALGIGSRTLDDWMARHRMLYRKFPSKNPRNGIVLFPAPWLIGFTGPIEIEVITGEEDGERVVSREILTATMEIEGKVGISTLAHIHSVCGNTVRQWLENKWISPIDLPSGHLRFDAKVVEGRLSRFDVPAFVKPTCDVEIAL